MMQTCVCEKCGNVFDEEEIEKIPYKEYPGAGGTQYDFVSPCCHAAYSYRDHGESKEAE